MKEQNTYTASELERYHSGKMSDSEMHALERAALQDPFLADALEGYRFTSTATEDIEELKEKLNQQKNKPKTFVGWRNNKFLRIAAMFILIAGIGYFAYQVNSNEKEDLVSHKYDELKQPTPVTAADSVKDMTTLAAPESTGKKNNNILSIKPADITTDKPTVQPPVAMNEDVQERSDAARNYSKSSERYIKGQVVDDRGIPISRAFVKDLNKNTTITTDSSGRFVLAAKDSAVTATVAAPGYSVLQKKLNDKTEQVIVLQEDKRADENLKEATALAEVKAKQRAESKVSNAQTREITVAEPVGGWNKFREYLKKYIRPVTENGKTYKGNVVLSFEINRNGKPVKIKVEQSVCNACDAEAIRLLKDGPRWNMVKERQRLIIEF